MKIANLYLNQTAMLKDMNLRSRLSLLIEDASADQLKALGFIILHQSWDQKEIEYNLGSREIEELLDCIENADHQKLHEVKECLEKQGIPT
jgi:hypothetical protein